MTSPKHRTARHGIAVVAIALNAAGLFAIEPVRAQSSGGTRAPSPGTEKTDMVQHPYVGMWVTADGYIRHELLANGRYDEARGNRKSAYRGRYTLKGNHIDYVDDTGFTADGDFIDGVLHHGGMIFHREVSK